MHGILFQMGKQWICLLQKAIICSKMADIALQKLLFILHGKQHNFLEKVQRIFI